MTPNVRIRDAVDDDADVMAELILELGYEVQAAEVATRLMTLRSNNQAVLLAETDGRVVGVLTTSRTLVLHRPRPVGRISMLVVSQAHRSAGVGALLVGAAEARLREQGCGLVEVTSTVVRERAHVFYERLGYERTSTRFAKSLI